MLNSGTTEKLIVAETGAVVIIAVSGVGGTRKLYNDPPFVSVISSGNDCKYNDKKTEQDFHVLIKPF